MGKLKGIRFLYVSRYWLPMSGGAELEAHNFVSRLISEGADVEVVTFHPVESEGLGYKVTRIVHPDFDPEATDSDRYSYQWYDWNRSRLFDHLSEGSWDVVIHFNDLGPQDFGYSNHHRFKDWVNIGRIWDPPVSLNKGWSEWPWHLGYDLLLLPTQYHYDTTGLNSNEPAMVLPPAGVETLSNIDELDDLDSRPYDFGFINPIHHKGVELVAKLVGRFPTKRFLVKAGNYRSQAQLDKLSNWPENVEVAGWYDNIDDYYRACKAILYPSLQEGFGMVSYEALANGCLTFANAHPVMKSACPIGPVYIDAYPDSTKSNYFKYRLGSHPSELDHHMEIASEFWFDEIEEVLDDSERIEQLRSKGLEALPYLEQHIESCYQKFYDYVVDAVAKKSI